jgi:hypothetical protein
MKTVVLPALEGRRLSKSNMSNSKLVPWFLIQTQLAHCNLATGDTKKKNIISYQASMAGTVQMMLFAIDTTHHHHHHHHHHHQFILRQHV